MKLLPVADFDFSIHSWFPSKSNFGSPSGVLLAPFSIYLSLHLHNLLARYLFSSITYPNTTFGVYLTGTSWRGTSLRHGSMRFRYGDSSALKIWIADHATWSRGLLTGSSREYTFLSRNACGSWSWRSRQGPWEGKRRLITRLRRAGDNQSAMTKKFD